MILFHLLIQCINPTIRKRKEKIKKNKNKREKKKEKIIRMNY